MSKSKQSYEPSPQALRDAAVITPLRREHLAASYGRRHEIRDVLVSRALGTDVPEHVDVRLSRMTYPDLCRAFLEAQGREVPVDGWNAIRAAVSGGEGYDSLATASVNASILGGYRAEADNSEGLAFRVSVRDFKTVETFILNEEGTLELLPRGEPAPAATIVLRRETWSIARYAKQLIVDEQDWIDGRFEVVLRAAASMGQAARRLIPDLVFSRILENPALSTDSTAVFHTDHDNLGTAALASTSIDDAIAAIESQTTTDRDGNPIHLGLRPAVLLVPPALHHTARALVRDITLGDGRDIEVRSESRISDTSVVDPSTGEPRTGSTTNWYVAARPTNYPGLVLGARNGRFEPSIRATALTGGSWGTSFDVVLDVGCAWVDYRSWYRSSGTA